MIVSLGPLPLAVLALAIGGYAAVFRRGFLVSSRLWYATLLAAVAPALGAPFFDAESSFHGNRSYALVVGCVVLVVVALIAKARGYFAYNVTEVAFERALQAAGIDESAVILGDSLWPVALHVRPRRGSKLPFAEAVKRLREQLRGARNTGVLIPAFHVLVAALALTPLIVTQSRGKAPYQALPDAHSDLPFSVKAP